jgi:hypothetical protein
MSTRYPTRQAHNPHQLKCPHGCNQWFKTAGGRKKHIRSVHNAEAVMHPRQQSPEHHDLNPNESIQSSPPLSYITRRSSLSPPDGNIPMSDNRSNSDPPEDRSLSPPDGDIPMSDNLSNSDPPEDLPFAQSPARTEPPLEGEIIIQHHPLINGEYTV